MVIKCHYLPKISSEDKRLPYLAIFRRFAQLRGDRRRALANWWVSLRSRGARARRAWAAPRWPTRELCCKLVPSLFFWQQTCWLCLLTSPPAGRRAKRPAGWRRCALRAPRRRRRQAGRSKKGLCFRVGPSARTSHSYFTGLG